MRSWITLGLVAVLAVGTVPSAHADDPAELAKTLSRLNQTLDRLQAQLDKIDGNLTTEGVRGAAVATQVRELNDRVTQLEHQVADVMNQRGQAAARNYYDPRNDPRSNYYAPANPATAPGAVVANRGLIRLENRYSVPVTVSINGRPYAVPPFETREVRGMPAGVFTYEVMAEGFGLIQPQVARTLVPNGSHNIYVNPPAVAALP